MELKETIHPLEKLKIRPKPQKRNTSVFFLEVEEKGEKDEKAQECVFADNRPHAKIDRAEIMKNILLNKQKRPHYEAPAAPRPQPKKIDLKVDIVEAEAEAEKVERRPEPKRVEKNRVDEEQVERKPRAKREEPEEEIVHEDNPTLQRMLARVPQPEPLRIKTSTFYLNNRKKFLEKIEEMFSAHKTETGKNRQDLLLHQRIAREYLNIYTPYRGLLLYYGLGTGKSATAVAIAEGLKSDKRVFLMIPASLETNFMNEIKKFGDPIYRKKQHWNFVSIEGQPQYVQMLSSVLSLPTKYIRKNKGAWLMNNKKDSNFDTLKNEHKEQIDDQLIEMIKTKYHQINYNANNLKKVIDDLSLNGTVNPFDNSVVIVDEAHKLVSLIVNKLNKGGKKDYVSLKIYNYLMTASNCRVVLLTGTPIVNYPNEIAVLFNILRGSIKTWVYQIRNNQKMDRDRLLDLFNKNGLHTYDYVAVANGKIQITRNPFGFINHYKGVGGTTGGTTGVKGWLTNNKPHYSVKTKKNRITGTTGTTSSHNKTKKRKSVSGGKTGGTGEFNRYDGVQLDETGNLTDADFQNNIQNIFAQNDVQVDEVPTIETYKTLPDTLDEFNEKFLNIENVEHPRFKDKQNIVFIKRILGLTSYYRVSDTDANLPTLIDEKTDLFHIQYCPMSDHQFENYRTIRKKEVEQQKRQDKNKRNNQNKNDVYEISSTYRVYSRAVCNFAFPVPPGRPFPDPKNSAQDEDEVDGEIAGLADLLIEGEPLPEVELPYKQRITDAMKYLKDNEETVLSMEGLQTYSPKFARILENIKTDEHVGLHLVYSQFRTLEGIGIFQSVMEANGFVQFKVKKENGEWKIQPYDKSKPTFVLYTGTEDQEERELVRNIYNGDWNDIPSALHDELVQTSSNNLTGEIVKVILITSSAAEGINLRNTRYVHLMEPYWHMVRLQQVIGRARRYQSHLGLPAELQTVKVFLYLASFSDEQIHKINTTIGEGELKATDVSKRPPFALFTTDQSLFETAEIKIKISNELLNSVKSASVDCKLHHNSATDSFSCYDLGNVETNEFAFKPSLTEDILEQGEDKKAVGTGVKLTIRGTEYYAYKEEKNNPDLNVFDLYSDGRLKNKVAVFDKVNKKLQPIK